MLVQALDDAGSDAAGRDKLLNTGVTHADQGKLRGGEKRIRRYQEKDEQHPEQHEGEHGWAILALENSCQNVYKWTAAPRLSVERWYGHPEPKRGTLVFAFATQIAAKLDFLFQIASSPENLMNSLGMRYHFRLRKV